MSLYIYEISYRIFHGSRDYNLVKQILYNNILFLFETTYADTTNLFLGVLFLVMAILILRKKNCHVCYSIYIL